MSKKILIIQSSYGKKNPSGENAMVAEDEMKYSSLGYDVKVYVLSPEILDNLCSKIYLLFFLFNPFELIKLSRLIHKEKFDLILYNNLFPYLSPSVLFAGKCKKVYRSHNFRSFCINGLFFRSGKFCTACLSNSTYGVVKSCYKNSIIASLVMKSYTYVLNASLKRLGILISCINPKMADLYRYKGFNSILEANEVFPANELSWNPEINRLALFSRLSSEKGVLEVAIQCALENIPLDIYGAGPLEKELVFWCGRESSVRYMGLVKNDDVEKLMVQYKAIIVNSAVLEGFPVMLAKCIALQIPAIISDTIDAKKMLKRKDTLLLYNNNDRFSIKRVWDEKLSSTDFRKFGNQEVMAEYRDVNHLI